MSWTTRRNSWLLCLAAAGVLAVGVTAAGPMGGRREVFSQLDLSAEQKTAIRDIVRGQRSVFEPLADQASAARTQLFEAVHASTLDEGAVRAASERVAKARLALAIERARTVARVREILSPEQRKTLDAARDERLARVGERGRHVRRMMRDGLDDSLDSY